VACCKLITIKLTTKIGFLKFIEYKNLKLWSAYALLGKDVSYTQKYPFIKIGGFLKRNKIQVLVENKILYKRITIRTNAQGIKLRDEIYGEKIDTKKQFRILFFVQN